jgi:1,4-dihydroxy-2-naphthoate octaprenyltransferase
MGTSLSRSTSALNEHRWERWWVASRPRTLTMALAPVLAGSSLAWSGGAAPNWPVFALTLLCAVLIQVGTNLLNDVADHEKGNDGADRVGPLRITAAGWATPAEVRRAAWLAFGTALALGLVLVWRGGPAILALGLVSIAAGWAYSGGRRPISYRASGEVFVLAFFGLVAVTGSHYLQAGHWSPVAVVAGAALGAMAAAVLLLNNYRDLGPDRAAGRRTLAAVLGPHRSRALYAALMLLPFALPAWLALRDPTTTPYAWLAWLAAPLAVNAIAGMRARTGRALNAVLGQTAITQFAFALLLSVGLLF